MIKFNDMPIEFGSFPNGEVYFNSLTEQIQSDNTITIRFDSNEDIFNLWLVVKDIDSHNEQYVKLSGGERIKLSLNIAYMPYSRMDRKGGEQSFTLAAVTSMINRMYYFDEVCVLQPHSSVTCELLNHSVSVPVSGKLFLSSLSLGYFPYKFDLSRDIICYPDAGAMRVFRPELPIRYCNFNKKRDFTSGNIISHCLAQNKAVIDGRHVVIIDDLCSKGGTFVSAAQVLYNAGALSVSLVVAHCEPNIFNGRIFSHDSENLIQTVITTNSILQHRDVNPNVKTEGKLFIDNFENFF